MTPTDAERAREIAARVRGEIVTTGIDSAAELIAASYAAVRAPLEAANRELAAALMIVTDHFAAVMGGPMIAGSGVRFANGVEGIPTIMQARGALAKHAAGCRA